MLVLVHYERAWSRLVTSRLPLLTLRAFFVVMANSLYFVALAEIPLAEANAIFFVAPMFITILSIPMLGEKVGWYRWGAVFIGFAGVVVMLRPGSGLFQWIAISPILGALSYAMLLGCEDCPRPPDNLSVAVDRPGLHQIGPSTSIPRLFV